MVVRNSSGDVVREMSVPGEAGVHRVNWDLRWGMPGEVDRWERFEDERLARPVGPKGPWVSPGTYTVSVESQGSQSTVNLTVHGDPMSDLTAADYQAREAFMVQALGLMEDARSALAGSSGDRRDELQGAMRGVQRLLGGMNGSGVRGGTLHPPTQTQRDALAALARVIRGGM